MTQISIITANNKMQKEIKLTKSHYLLYLDAPKHLWAYVNDKIEKKDVDTFTQNLFEQGYQVQEYAKKYLLQDLIPQKYHNTNQYTFELTKSDELFEIRIDFIIFNAETNKWDIYEIKSTNSIKTIHKRDITFQYLVLQKHFDIGESYILHLNKEYERIGKLAIEELFTATNVSVDIQELIDTVNQERYDALQIINNPDPTQIDSCIKPKHCPCINLCHPDLPEHPIYEIRRISGSKSKVAFLESNYGKDINNIPSDSILGKNALTTPQRQQVDVAQSGNTIFEKFNISEMIDSLVFPLYFIDYESFNPAIPMYERYKPYDQMPFQYSLHIKTDPQSPMIHKEFIETEKVDPSINMIKAMQNDIGEKGSIIIWSKFERTQNNAIKRRYPQYTDLIDNMNNRLWDLMEIFQKNYYLHPDFRGSYSIKKVLPVLVPELTYKNMAISDGSMAMTKWVQMVYGGGITATAYSDTEEYESEPVDIAAIEIDRNQKETIKNDLLRYCELDTFAMVKILDVILEKV